MVSSTGIQTCESGDFQGCIQPLPFSIYNRDSSQLLKSFPTNCIDLVYLDPPFFSNRDYWINSSTSQRFAFSDRWRRGLDSYCKWMKEIAVECERILKNGGSLYLHCDTHASHYLKVVLDEVFGVANFHNEIVWKRQSAHNDWTQGAKSYGRIHDVILYYSKGPGYTWNPVFEPFSEAHVRRAYRHVESGTGRRYSLGDLTGPGGASKGNPRYKFLGVERYWRYSKERMKKLYQEGRIIQRKPGNVPLLKRYLDEMNGRPIQDVWDDISSAKTAHEKTGYPTQKPLRLVRRIIQVSSKPGDIILDPFCGSGSSLVASYETQRRWIGIDNSRTACSIALRRLRRAGEINAKIIG